MALDNIWLMVPFVRTLAQADAVLALMAQNGIRREDWKIVMMCEVPSNVILADAFLDRFDGFSIGSNDLTQLTLALDRDSELVADAFDERDPAVKEMIARAISACRVRDKYVGICGHCRAIRPSGVCRLAGGANASVPYRSIRMLCRNNAHWFGGAQCPAAILIRLPFSALLRWRCGWCLRLRCLRLLR